MDLWDLLKEALPWALPAIILLSCFFEFTKIPINPLSALFKWISGKVTSTTDEKMDNLEKKIDEKFDNIDEKFDQIVFTKSAHYQEIIDLINTNQKSVADLSKEIDIQGMETYRWTILGFANDIRMHNPKSKDEFMHIFDISNKYHHLIDKYSLKNGLIDTEMALIEKRYKEHCTNNDFLA